MIWKWDTKYYATNWNLEELISLANVYLKCTDSFLRIMSKIIICDNGQVTTKTLKKLKSMPVNEQLPKLGKTKKNLLF